MHLNGHKFVLESRRMPLSRGRDSAARMPPWEGAGERAGSDALCDSLFPPSSPPRCSSSAFSLRVDDGGGGGYAKINFERRKERRGMLEHGVEHNLTN